MEDEEEEEEYIEERRKHTYGIKGWNETYGSEIRREEKTSTEEAFPLKSSGIGMLMLPASSAYPTQDLAKAYRLQQSLAWTWHQHHLNISLSFSPSLTHTDTHSLSVCPFLAL